MRYSYRPVLGLSLVLLSCFLFGQTQNALAQKTSASGILARAQGAVSGGMEIQDVVLTGTVRRIAGSTDETGQVELKALASGEARLDLAFPSGPLSEVYARGAHGMVGQWSGPDQKAHAIPVHNLLVDPTWFNPALALQRVAQSRERVVTEVGASKSLSASGPKLEHLRVERDPQSRQNPASNPSLNEITRKVQEAIWAAPVMDFYLDPVTHLPVEMRFNTHPDKNLGENIPVRVRYSDYRPVDGIQTPFHLQKFMNGNLMLEIQLESATVNSGVAANAFVVTAETSQGVAQ